MMLSMMNVYFFGVTMYCIVCVLLYIYMHSIKALDLSNLILVYRTMPRGRGRGRGRRGWGRPHHREVGRGVAVEGPPQERSETGPVTVTPPPVLPPVQPPPQVEPPPQPTLPLQVAPEAAPPVGGVDANTRLMCDSIKALIQTLVTNQQASLQQAQEQAQAQVQEQAQA